MSDKNLNLNKNLLEAGGGGEYIKYVRIKEGQAKCVRGEKGGGVNFGDFSAYVPCGWPFNINHLQYTLT